MGIAAPEPKEAETLRTGPMVRRGANVMRTAQATSSPTRQAALSRIFEKQPPPADLPTSPPLIESSCLHIECKLPINLRKFLAEHLGHQADDDDSILDLAAHADEATLSKLARAIRRYSTTRAHESWSQCSVPLARLASADGNTPEPAALCLQCANVEFGADAMSAHQGPACVAISLSRDDCPERADAKTRRISDRIQRSVEEFRALRVAFGLPHFDLDCYVHGAQIVFTWRPLP